MRGYTHDTPRSQKTSTAMKWTPEKISELRRKRDESQTEFGLAIYDTNEQTAQVLVSDLERGRMKPGKAAQRTLERMEDREV